MLIKVELRRTFRGRPITDLSLLDATAPETILTLPIPSELVDREHPLLLLLSMTPQMLWWMARISPSSHPRGLIFIIAMKVSGAPDLILRYRISSTVDILRVRILEGRSWGRSKKR